MTGEQHNLSKKVLKETILSACYFLQPLSFNEFDARDVSYLVSRRHGDMTC